VFSNASQLHHDAARRYSQFGESTRRAVLAAPFIPLASRLPRSIKPAVFGFANNDVSLGWLIDGVRAGRVPRAEDVSATDLADETLRLALVPSSTPARTCRTIRQATRLVLESTQRITLKRVITTLQYVDPQRVSSRPVRFKPGTLTALAGPLPLLVTPGSNPTAEAVVLCT